MEVQTKKRKGLSLCLATDRQTDRQTDRHGGAWFGSNPDIATAQEKGAKKTRKTTAISFTLLLLVHWPCPYPILRAGHCLLFQQTKPTSFHTHYHGASRMLQWTMSWLSCRKQSVESRENGVVGAAVCVCVCLVLGRVIELAGQWRFGHGAVGCSQQQRP